LTAAYQEQKPPHPVAFDVAYPERVSRLTTFFRLFLAIPQFIVVYLLQIALALLTVLAWFAILFTGRYPKAFFDFTSGVLRWQANVIAYAALLRDEYPPFSWEPGDYALTLDIPHAERQSRFRLFVRVFTILPNQVVFLFVQIAWAFTTFLSFFMILFTGRYPRGLFKFAVGAIRWQMRIAAYLYLLRDEYPPYSINAGARPGNEVVSAIIGVPLLVLILVFSALPFLAMLGNETDTVRVQSPLTSATISIERPSGEANGVRVTLLGYNDNARAPLNVRIEEKPGYHVVSFRVRAEKDGFLPAFFTPFLFRLNGCDDDGYSPVAATSSDAGFMFGVYWFRGGAEGNTYFQVPDAFQACDLTYRAGLGTITFAFDRAATAAPPPAAVPNEGA